MTRIYGVVIGIVRDVNDPLREGRIRVRFPWLSDDDLSGWAPIAKTMAGGRRGYWYMPELEDEALVAFEHGDVQHPFVLGFLHNGADLPPDDGIDVSVRRVRTVSGHVLEFDDRPGRERILLRTQGGHELEMNDADGTVELSTTGGQRVVLRDLPGEVTLSTTSGTTVRLSDGPSSVQIMTVGGVTLSVSDAGGVSVSAPAGMLTVTCLGATVNASSSLVVNAPAVAVNAGMVSVNSAMAAFSGVVQCTTLIASTVVSSAYTPGVGNLW